MKHPMKIFKNHFLTGDETWVYDYNSRAKLLTIEILAKIKKDAVQVCNKARVMLFYETFEDKMFCMVKLLISISVYKFEICVM